LEADPSAGGCYDTKVKEFFVLIDLSGHFLWIASTIDKLCA
jgi:hypothetical protein